MLQYSRWNGNFTKFARRCKYTDSFGSEYPITWCKEPKNPFKECDYKNCKRYKRKRMGV